MQRLRPRWAIGIVFFVLVLIAGMKVVAIVTADPEPPLPPLLQGLGSVGGSTTVCPPASVQEAAVRGQDSAATAWTPELQRRLEREFPPGSDPKQMGEWLRTLGFQILGSCRSDPSIRYAYFEQHGGFPLRPGALPMWANVWWKVDVTDHLIWAK